MLGGIKLIKAIVFDFDGLIIDTETVWYHACLSNLMHKINVLNELPHHILLLGSTWQKKLMLPRRQTSAEL